MLGDRFASRVSNSLHSQCAVATHAGEECGYKTFARTLRSRPKQDIHRGPAVMDGWGVQQPRAVSISIPRDCQMGIARRNHAHASF